MEYDEIIKRSKMVILKSSAIVAFILLWEAAPHLGLINPIFIPPPSVVAAKMYELLLSGELLVHISASAYFSEPGTGFLGVYHSIGRCFATRFFDWRMVQDL